MFLHSPLPYYPHATYSEEPVHLKTKSLGEKEGVGVCLITGERLCAFAHISLNSLIEGR